MKFTYFLFPLTWFTIVILLLGIGHCTELELNQQSNLTTNPKLEIKWLERSTAGWFVHGEGVQRNPGVKFTREGRIVVTPRVSTLHLTCSAHYPVHWEYDIPEEISYNDYFIIVTTQRVSENFENPASYKFFSHLFLSGDGRGITGNYTCTGANDESLRVNRYIFWEDSVRDLIFGHLIDNTLAVAGKPQPCVPFSCPDKPSKTAMADKDNQTLILPCTVCKPEIPIQLFKRHYNSSILTYDDEEVKLTNSSITFDPAHGFILKIQELPSPFGVYNCVLNFTQNEFYEKSDEAFLVRAVNEIKKPWSDEVNNTMVGNSKYMYRGSILSSQTVCCSNGARPPKIYVRDCATRFYCQKVKRQLRNFEYPDLRAFSYRNCTSSDIQRYGKSGAFRCVGDGIDVTREYYTRYSQDGNKFEIFYDDEISNVPKLHFITLSPKSGNVNGSVADVYADRSLTIECHSSTYIFATGIRWTIIWKNHTKQLIPNTQNNTGSLDLANHGININSTNSVDSVVCHAPLHGSTEWVNATLKLNIIQSVRPTIDGPEVERLVWREGELNKELTCQAKGNPIPKISWRIYQHESVQTTTPPDLYSYDYGSYDYLDVTKYSVKQFEVLDGNGNRDIIESEAGFSKLTFKKVFQTMAAKYRCHADSLAGHVEKTFEVTIQGQNTSILQVEVNEVLNEIMPEDDYDVLNVTNTNIALNSTKSTSASTNPIIADMHTSDNSVSIVSWILGLLLLICCGIATGLGLLWVQKKKRQNQMTDAQSVRSFQAMVQSDSYEEIS